MWRLLKPIYGLSTKRKEWYGSLKCALTGKLGRKATLLDKSVSFGRSGVVTASGEVSGRNVSGVTKKWFLRLMGILVRAKSEMRSTCRLRAWAIC